MKLTRYPAVGGIYTIPVLPLDSLVELDLFEDFCVYQSSCLGALSLTATKFGKLWPTRSALTKRGEEIINS